MQEKKTANLKIKRKPASMEVIEKRLKFLQNRYSDEVEFFNSLFLVAIHSNIDFSITRRKKWWAYSNYKIKKDDYDEAILTCLEVQKWIYNSINRKKLRDEDLIFIRWQAVAIHFGLKDSVYETVIKKHSNTKNFPKDYKKAVTYPWTIWEDDDIEKGLSAKKNNLANYLKPFKFEHHKKLIDLLMKYCDNPAKWMNTLLIQESVKSFLHDIDIDKNAWLTYTKKEYSHSDNSFNAVFYSEQGKESYFLTRIRFCENYFDKIEPKFNKIVWKKTPKIKK